jgi:hypothetical protein
MSELIKDVDYYVYDESYLRFHDDYLISPSNNLKVADYLFGRCHLFAYVLAKKRGFDFGFMINDEPCMQADEEDSDLNAFEALPELNHAFCYQDKNNQQNSLLIDARGLISRKEIIDLYTTTMVDLDNNIEVVNPEDLLREWMNGGLLLGFLPHEEEDLGLFVDKMIKSEFLKVLPEDFETNFQVSKETIHTIDKKKKFKVTL